MGIRRWDVLTVGIVVTVVAVVVVVVAVQVDEEDNSSGSVEFGTDDDEEFVKDLEVSSVSFSVEIRRETAQR